MTTYKFLVAVDYDKSGKHYGVGDVDTLEDWRKTDVKSALRANLIERVEGGKASTTTAASTDQPNGTSVVSFDTIADLQISDTKEAAGGETWQPGKQ